METLKIDGSLTTPKIIFDKDNAHFEITGKSNPEDVVAFYQPVLLWLDDYMKNPLPSTVFDIKLTYYNTATSKIILELMKKLELLGAHSEVSIRWFYEEEDEDMMELGEDYDAIVGLEFEHIPVEFIEDE